mgnify:CR=1 FL=1
MTKNMYTVAWDGPCNEELALRIQTGDKKAAGLIISQNEGYITKLAQEYTPWCEMEDLKQEAALALLDAAGRFAPAYGTKLLTYATPAIEAALSDYAAQYSSPLSIPISRYNQLRRVAYLCAEGWDLSDAELVKVVCGELNVSAKVAGALIKEYWTLFCVRQLGDDVFSVSCGGDPAVAYDRLLRRTLLMQRIGGADAQRAESGAKLPWHRSAGRGWYDLSGTGDPAQLQRPQWSGEGVQGCAAEVKEGLVRRRLWAVALRTEGHPRRQSGGGAGRGVSLHLNDRPSRISKR